MVGLKTVSFFFSIVDFALGLDSCRHDMVARIEAKVLVDEVLEASKQKCCQKCEGHTTNHRLVILLAWKCDLVPRIFCRKTNALTSLQKRHEIQLVDNGVLRSVNAIRSVQRLKVLL